MRNFRNYFMFLAVVGLLFTSCSKDENAIDNNQETATLTFGTDLQDFTKAMLSKQQVEPGDDVGACVEGDPAIAQITIEYGGTSETVYVEILGDDATGYFTAYHEDLEIPVTSGDHVSVTLTDFVVWTDDNNDGTGDRVLWVAPKVGSLYAGFVTNAIGSAASTWNLRAGSKTYVDVEVLCFDDREVNRYGYQFFDIIPNELQTVCFFANYCTDDGRHYTANYTLDLYTFSGTPSEERPASLAGYTNIYDNVGIDEEDMGIDGGVYYADPLCVSVPMLGDGEYIYYEATISTWDDNYDPPANHVVWGYISQDDIDDMVTGDMDNDPDTMDYEHLFFNCPEGNSVIVDPTPPSDCPGEPVGDDCFQIDYDNVELTIENLGLDENPTIPLIYNDDQVGEIVVNLDGESNLTATFQMDAGYVVSAAEMRLNDYFPDVQGEAARQVCVENLEGEETFVLTFENLLSADLSGLDESQIPTIEGIYPIMYDLTVNFCQEE